MNAQTASQKKDFPATGKQKNNRFCRLTWVQETGVSRRVMAEFGHLYTIFSGPIAVSLGVKSRSTSILRD